MTKTETLRRLRTAAQMAKKADWLPSNYRVEVGTRFKPVTVVGRVPNVDEAFDPEDDLDNYWGLSESTKFMPDQVRQPGYIAHLYIAEPENGWGGGELVNVITVWPGDENHEPQLLHVPGKRQETLDRINAEVRS